MKEGTYITVSLNGHENLTGIYIKRMHTGKDWITVKMPDGHLENRMVYPHQVRENVCREELLEGIGTLDESGKRG